VNCTQCGAQAEPGQFCPSCGTLQPMAPLAAGTNPSWGQAPTGPPPPPGGGQQQAYPAYGAPATAGPPPPPGPPSYGVPGPAYGAPTGPPPGQFYPPYQPTATAYPTGSKTNGLAIASLVCALAGFFCGITAPLGVIFGFVARGQIKRSAGLQTGNGLAIAGIIVGLIICLLIVLWIVLVVAFGTLSFNTNNGN
jgi:hypothetical protein